MTRDEYNHLPGIRRSTLVHMKKSPKHYHHAVNVGFEKTEAMFFGIMFHTFVLEPLKFKKEYVLYDLSKRANPSMTMAANANKEWHNQQMESMDSLGQHPVTPEQLEQMKSMRDSLFSEPEILELLTYPGQFEKAFQWTDEETGLQCKCLVDKDLPKLDLIIDLKTCKSAEFDKFTRDAATYDLDFQTAYYLDGTKRKNMAFLCVENTEPFACSLFYPDPDEFTAFGRDSYKRCLAAVKDCQETDKWPSYSYWSPRGGYSLELPVWKQRSFI